MYQKKVIPDRWADYTNFKSVIKECHILPCKTPLKIELFLYGTSNGILRDDQSLTPDNLCQMVGEHLQSSVEFVIDFTNTSRYYDCTDFQNRGIKYIKIECVGKQIPSQNVYTRFHNAMEKCLQLVTPQGVIAVHCTHGINRSGFLVCNYLINKYEYSVEEAVRVFNDARGHDIERTEYIDQLIRHIYPIPNKNTFEFVERPVDIITTDSIAVPTKDQPTRSRRKKRERINPNHQSPKKRRSSANHSSTDPHPLSQQRYPVSSDTQPHQGYHRQESYQYTEQHASYRHCDPQHYSYAQDRYTPHHRYPDDYQTCEPRHKRPVIDTPYPEYRFHRDEYSHPPREYQGPHYHTSREYQETYYHTSREYQETYFHPPPSHLPPHAWGPPAYHPKGSFRVESQQSAIKHRSNERDIRTYPGVPHIKH